MPPLKLAIIGGGPSAFYLTSRLLRLISPTDIAARIHIYDRLWAPYGLVRYGVAPDHPEVKNCTHKFDTMASDPQVRFFGNVNVGVRPAPFPRPIPSTSTGKGTTGSSGAQTANSEEQLSNSEAQTAISPLQPHALPLPLHDLFPYYTHLVFATGAPMPRLHPLLPRSNVCISALDIVHWYTMHPSSPSSTTFRSPIPLGTRHITLIGHGNVSLDIARILLTPPARLACLDVPAHVLRELETISETLRQVSIVGRRGPLQVKFTPKELREMMNLEEARMWAIPEDVIDDVVKDGVGKPQARIIKLLREGSKIDVSFSGESETKKFSAGVGSGIKKTFNIEFWRSPTGYTVLAPQGEDARAVLQLEKTKLLDGRAVGTGEYESVHTDLIVTSLGYEGDPAMLGNDGGTPDADSQTISLPWFDASPGRMRVRGGDGRVLTPDGEVVRNVYASGWAGKGASGVLAGTLQDADNVALSIMKDWEEDGNVGGPLANGENVEGGLDGIPPIVRTGVQEGQVVVVETWKKMDEEERRRGGGVKERERMRWAEVAKYLNPKGRRAG